MDYDYGVLTGQVKTGGAVAIIGAGVLGIAALLTAKFYTAAAIIIDRDDQHFDLANCLGTTAVLNNSANQAAETVLKLTGERGVDTVVETTGIPSTQALCQKILAADGKFSKIPAAVKPVDHAAAPLWRHEIAAAMRLVDAEF